MNYEFINDVTLNYHLEKLFRIKLSNVFALAKVNKKITLLHLQITVAVIHQKITELN